MNAAVYQFVHLLFYNTDYNIFLNTPVTLKCIKALFLLFPVIRMIAYCCSESLRSVPCSFDTWLNTLLDVIVV